MRYTLAQALSYIMQRIDNNRDEVIDIEIPEPQNVIQEVHIDPAPLVQLNSAAIMNVTEFASLITGKDVIRQGTSQAWSLISMRYYPWARNNSTPWTNTYIGHKSGVNTPTSMFVGVQNEGAAFTRTDVDGSEPIPSGIPLQVRNTQNNYNYSYGNKASAGLNSLRNFPIYFESYRGDQWIDRDGQWHPKSLIVNYTRDGVNLLSHTITTVYFRATYSNYYSYGQLYYDDSEGTHWETSGQTGHTCMLINVDVPSDCTIISFDIV